ncbi:acetate/propionate family kinase [Porphyromonas sp.]
MKILVLNCGSSSLKFALIELPTYRVLTSGNEERVGINDSFIRFKRPDGTKEERHLPIPDHTRGVEIILDILREEHFVASFDEIDAIGHRLVHGGERFASSVRINGEVLEKLRECVPLAPLHNPANILGIEAVTKVLPQVPQVGVFDTAFHQTMPEHAFMYALPYEFYSEFGIRRYGFHGTSHQYVSEVGAELAGIDLANSKIVTAHVGSGASMAAILNGRSIDTSMGLTPNEGLMMGTRAGDIDSGVLDFLLAKKDYRPEFIAPYLKNDKEAGKTELSLQDLTHLLTKKSGLEGISTQGSDMRDVAKAAEGGSHRDRLAITMHAYRVKKYVGAYAAALGGLDLLIFTAGVGENRPPMRTEVCQGLEFLGIKIDEELNQQAMGRTMLISAPDSRVKVAVVATDEEYMIAKDTYRIVSEG